MKKSVNNDFENVSKGTSHSDVDMESIANEVASGLNLSGGDGRIVSENRLSFDREYLKRRNSGLPHDQAVNGSIAAVSLDLAKNKNN